MSIQSSKGYIFDLFVCRYVGPYLALSADLAFVLEDDAGVCGYVLAVLDSAQFYQDFRTIWLPQMTAKYPVVGQTEQVSPEKVRLSVFFLLHCSTCHVVTSVPLG